MELKPYQQEVITDLARFLDCVQATKNLPDAFHDFWATHPRTPLQPFPGTAIEPYKNTVPGVPHVTIKVPTAGGKTFIASNALRTIFAAFPANRPKAVVWLVPSITILNQTLRSLRDPLHPYRQKISTHFAGRVEVYDKAALLQGSGFSASSVQEQLSLVVLSFDSLRARNKEDRKVYQENGNLQSFGTLLGPGDEDITLMRVIQALNPVVVVDESHNAESDLSVDMLKNLNPAFILDLTATPRKNSNIISFVDALALKKEHMVKLPVIVYNHNDLTEVINSALQLQRNLELQAKQEQKAGGRYIRPIVLFQAQPKTADDNTTFELLKKKLIERKIPESHIRIKTAGLNELKNEDLSSPKCEVRYIITVNALKEGWDAPFAYILASLANKSSAVDVEQILGRVLRQPYVVPHAAPMLNMSYVLTASTKFIETLDKIVQGLNKAGFSSRDYKVADAATLAPTHAPTGTFTQAPFDFDQKPAADTGMDDLAAVDFSRVAPVAPVTEEAIDDTTLQPVVAGAVTSTVEAIAKAALEQDAAFKKVVDESTAGGIPVLPTELQSLVKTYPIKDIFREQAAALVLPQFYWKKPAASLFDSGDGGTAVLLEKEYLLQGFQLGKADTDIRFNGISSELYRVDLDETKKEATPTFTRIDGDAKERIMAFILDPARKDSRVKNFTRRILDLIGNLYPIADKEIEKYIRRILEDFTDEQFTDFANHEYTYTGKIKDKIRSLSEAYAQQQFSNFLDQDKAIMKPAYTFPMQIAPGETSKAITKSLYEKEGKINGFEEKVINEIANLPNIAFWTRNPERKGFRINGFINHYPDFIIQTKSGKTLVVETKGDHLDAETKISLGATWAHKAGNDFRYYMVYERRAVDGAHTLDSFLNILREI
ncbi:restriction endonuclease [Hymenobacter lapidiphilus]|uniref:DEAD/DEAH box helicase n=1 Tax=Hymenobacter sp. CCM 8763 TaxID=2303334 RepID=UPI000E348379|nr:DEAD/DEAH box helicase family protein [Hymenobacter sp. CCM 8763]RFP63418.1 restriction endonuclease [Hymenobacter sp. CCM 8763]